MIYSIPDFLSSMHDLETVVYATDRDNESRVLLDSIDYARPDWDIDRAGSKSRVDIATHKRVLTDGMWIAPYQVVTPETGEITSHQLGHFRLSSPSATLTGQDDWDGEPMVRQQASGTDIVDLLAGASLTETFYTPVNGLVMNDVKVLIQMATCGMMGPNLVLNHSFENEMTNWLGPVWSGGSSGSVSFASAGWTPVDGEKQWGPLLNTGVPANSSVYIYQAVPLSGDAHFVYLSGVCFRHGPEDDPSILIEFLDAANNTLEWQGVSFAVARFGGPFTRGFGVFSVPLGAASARIRCQNRRVGSGVSQTRTRFDDIRFGTCTQMPLPDSRINLPLSTATATTRIQTVVGKSYAYEAINADRLASIGHYAIYTMQDGVLTTSPVRELETAVPKRTYTGDDLRLMGHVQTERNTTNRHNHFVAIKESFEEGSVPLVANSYNDDPDDPWSIHNMPVSSADPIMAQDAVDQTALQALADAARDRASVTEVLRIQIPPDPALQVHDVIEIVGSELDEANGKWGIEHIAPGMSHQDPLTEIHARRTRRSKGAY